MLRAWCDRHRTLEVVRFGFARRDDAAQARERGVGRHAVRCESASGDTGSFTDETEQNVLASEPAVPEAPRFLLREDDRTPGSIGESSEHDEPSFFAAGL